jgi:hypothetical protein
MKKVVLVLGLILATLCGFSQEPTKIVTYKNSIGTWDATKKAYDFQPYSYAKITFTFVGDYITADDNAHSVYRVVNRLPDKNVGGPKVISGQCTDEKNVSCTFGIMTPADCRPSTIGIIYEGYMFMYVIEQE